MATTRAISMSDEYKLWRLACSRCSLCKEELVKNEKDGILGVMAHIVAVSEDWTRGKSDLNEEERNSYQNLILLCPNHHSMIDNDETTWTVEKLHKKKQAHEEWVRIQLSKGVPSISNVANGMLCYINVPRLALNISNTGNRLIRFNIKEDVLNEQCYLYDLGFELAQVMLIIEEILKDWKPRTLELADINSENIGVNIKFEAEFSSKGIPAPYKLSSCKMKGNIKKDPHIYCKVGERKIYFTINPRWITTMTAFGLFRERRTRFAGLGVLTRVQPNEAFITPLLIGLPKAQYDWGAYDWEDDSPPF